MLWRIYLIVGILVLGLFATAQYYGWSAFSVSETRGAGVGIARSVYHK